MASKQWHAGRELVVRLEGAWGCDRPEWVGRRMWVSGGCFSWSVGSVVWGQSSGVGLLGTILCVFSGEANSGEGHSRRCSRECGAGTAGLGAAKFLGARFRSTPGTRRSARSPTQSQVPDTVLERVLEFTFPVRGCNVGCRVPLPEGSFLAFDPPGGRVKSIFQTRS